jgi:hypothetical protein
MDVQKRRLIKLANLKDWCKRTQTKVKSHKLTYFEADATQLNLAVAFVADVVPSHGKTETSLNNQITLFEAQIFKDVPLS